MEDNKQEEAVIELPAKEESKPEPTESVTEESLLEQGLTQEEVIFAKEQGVIAEPKEDKEAKKDPSDQETEEKKDPEEKADETSEDESKEYSPDRTYEEEKELLGKFNSNEKALYHKQKRAIKRSQRAESERDLFKVKLEAKDREIAKLQKRDVLDDEDADIEKDVENNDSDLITRGDLKKMNEDKVAKENEAREFKKKIDQDENDCRLNTEEFPAYDEVVNLARKMMNEDETGMIGFNLAKAAADPLKSAPEFAYKVAKQHPDYAGIVAKSKEGKKEVINKESKVDRIVKNANKKTSSAALGGGDTSHRKVAESELTVEDMGGLPQAKWDKLKPETRDRLLREVSIA